VTTSRHTHSPREVGFFVEAALSPLSVSSVEWSDNGGVVEIYTTPDPLHTLRDIDNWTRFTKPGRKRIPGFAVQPDSVTEAKIPEYLPVRDIRCNLTHFSNPPKKQGRTPVGGAALIA